MAGAGKQDEPPGKKRRLDDGEVNGNFDDLWEGDDFQLTQDQWQNLDNTVHNILTQSQAPSHVNRPNLHNVQKARSPRTLGRGMPKSHSAGSFEGSQTSPAVPYQGYRAGFPVAAGNIQYPRNIAPRRTGTPVTPHAASTSISPGLPTQARAIPLDKSNSQKLKEELDRYKQEVELLNYFYSILPSSIKLHIKVIVSGKELPEHTVCQGWADHDAEEEPGREGPTAQPDAPREGITHRPAGARAE